MSKYILDDNKEIPIVAWLGPSGEMIRDDVMSAMREAGFNVSISKPLTGKIIEALDCAQNAGMRLIIQADGFDFGRMSPEQGAAFKLSAEQKKKIQALVKKTMNHPALYGYYIHDEPSLAEYNWIRQVVETIEEIDEYHMCYVNHNAPVIQGGYGAGTQEALWKAFVKQTHPKYLSYDHYCIEQKPKEFIEKCCKNAPNVFDEGIVVKPDYFWTLEFARYFCSILEIPLWMFTCSIPHWSYPKPTEGHLRFQLMCCLAYGVKGLQYFTYMGDSALCTSTGDKTETWHIAKKVNGEIRRLWEKMKELRSIGVVHNGPLWEGTRSQMPTPVEQWGMDHRGPKFQCIGDPAVIGLFDNPAGEYFAFVVNRNPVNSASISMNPELDDRVPHKWHPLLPGEGRLFKLFAEKPPEVVWF